MSLRPDGTYRCDRCDGELTNGGVHEAAVVSTLLDDQLVTLHFCWRPQRGAPHGCASRILSASALAAFRTGQEQPQ